MSNPNANKAALYSAVIFPGAGLWWLKLYVRACIFIVPACLALIYIAKELYAAVEPVYSNLQRQAQEGLIGPSNFVHIYTTLSTQIHASLAQSHLGFVEAILVAAWVCSIISSYFAGKQLDLKAAANKP